MMPRYSVRLIIKSSAAVEVDAANEQEAVQKAKSEYSSSDIYEFEISSVYDVEELDSMVIKEE
jgi:tRNA(Ser,Leu) C12 N-acetylase TAN1